MSNKAASRLKPYASFKEFYPFYLNQHEKPLTKLLHFLGTTCALIITLCEPTLLIAKAIGLFLGAASFVLFRHLDSGLPEMAIMILSYLLIGCVLSGSAWLTFLLPISAYSFAWIAHFFVEGNRPATFVYPSYSLMGDLMMFYEVLLGRHAVW